MTWRNFLPSILFHPLRERMWQRFWQQEAEREKKALGVAPPDLRYSERGMFVEAIGNQFPISSLLEVGVAYGQNFHVLRHLLPSVKLLGVDRDAAIVAEANRMLSERGIEQSEIQVGEAEHLKFSDQSVDLVTSCACLLYVPEEAIRKVLGEMLRVSKGVVILAEQHRAGVGEFVKRGNAGYWIRDYQQLVQDYFPGCEVSLEKIKHPLWTAEKWQELGHIIHIRKGLCK